MHVPRNWPEYTDTLFNPSFGKLLNNSSFNSCLATCPSLNVEHTVDNDIFAFANLGEITIRPLDRLSFKKLADLLVGILLTILKGNGGVRRNLRKEFFKRLFLKAERQNLEYLEQMKLMVTFDPVTIFKEIISYIQGGDDCQLLTCTSHHHLVYKKLSL